MDRRRFLQTTGAMGAALAAFGKLPTARADAPGDASPESVVRYFMDPGELSTSDQESVESTIEYHERASAGAADFRPRGGNERAPTYRFLHWPGRIGDRSAGFVGPIAAKSRVRRAPAYTINAQVLGFHTADDDWDDNDGKGSITVEMRGQVQGESMTWLYAEMFEMYRGGTSSLGLEHIAQRDGTPSPVITTSPSLGIRVQLLKNREERGGILGRILAVASSLVGGVLAEGVSSGPGIGPRPVLRLPHMLREGVALSQAVFAGTTDRLPVWRSGFVSYAVGPGGGRLKLTPGIWVVVDDSREVDLRDAYIADLGGRLGIVRKGKVIDANHLVLDFNIRPAKPPQAYVTPRGLGVGS